MQRKKRFVAFLLALLLVLSLVSAAAAETEPVDLPRTGDYVIRIDGGYVSEHLETVNGKACLRVDLFLDGVTSARLLSSISFKLMYDAEQLTFVKHKALSGGYTNGGVTGLVQFAYASAYGTPLDDATPLLTLWFTVADDLPTGTQIRFAFSEAIKATFLASPADVGTHWATVGADLNPFGLGVLFGDANCDGRITAADAALVLRALVGLDTLSATGTENAKVGGGATFSAQDAALILRYVVGLIDRFPVEE